jgi:hypothetical protein
MSARSWTLFPALGEKKYSNVCYSIDVLRSHSAMLCVLVLLLVAERAGAFGNAKFGVQLVSKRQLAKVLR